VQVAFAFAFATFVFCFSPGESINSPRTSIVLWHLPPGTFIVIWRLPQAYLLYFGAYPRRSITCYFSRFGLFGRFSL
jgi:hypothetical protein